MPEGSKRKGPGFSSLILGSLILGIAAGLFFGDLAAPLQVLGQAYVGLLQMTVLPYILFSLIGNIGRLTRAQAGILARTGLIVLLALWAMAGLVVIAMAMALPHIPTGSFFSTSLVSSPPALDFLGLFIPSNLFQSLSSNAVPAVVLFSLLFGVALMEFDDKKSLLDQLDLLSRVLQKVNGMVVKLTPLGIFAITASAAGTLTLAEFGRLQAYLLTLTLAVLLLTLWVYPLLICAFTGLRWRRVVMASRDALLTAFVLGSVFAVIPLLIESIRRIIQEVEAEEPIDEHLPQLMLPLAYPFPDAGKILTLMFIPFAAWFYGNPLSMEEMGGLLLLGPIVMLGKVVTAVPFLLDMLEIPADIFQLFLASGVLMGRLSDMVGAMHLITFSVVTTMIVVGGKTISMRKLLASLGVVAAATAGMVVVINLVLFQSYKSSYDGSDVLLQMKALQTDVSIVVEKESGPNPMPLKPGQLHADRIAETGELRVGFVPDNLPFTFFNANGQLVGLDIDLMQELAADIGVSLVFVPYSIDQLGDALRNDHFDIAISGITATAERSRDVLFTDPYLYVNMALVVPDFRKRELRDEQHVRDIPDLKLGVGAGSYFADRAREHFQQATIVPLASEADFFNQKHDLDALVTSAEGGSAWTLLYPEFTTVNPVNNKESAPLAFAIPFEMNMEEYLELWIELRKLDGTMDRLFDYWILGQADDGKSHRWSVIRDVLGWIE